MKKENILTQDIRFTLQSIITIVETLGEETGNVYFNSKQDRLYVYKNLSSEKIEEANKFLINCRSYTYKFFEKDGIALVRIDFINGCYILPANTDILYNMKKEMPKAWAQCKNIEEKTVKPIKQVEETVNVFSIVSKILNTEAKNAPKTQPAKPVKPEPKPEKQPKIALNSDENLNLDVIMAKLNNKEFLFQKEISFLQKHAKTPAGYKYNRFAKLVKC